MNYKSLTDETLMWLIVNADDNALSELYDRYGRLVFSLSYSFVGDHPSAEEITQDVFMRVWGRAKTYSAKQAKVSTWLMSITRNRSIDVLRHRGVRPEKNSLSWNDVTASRTPRLTPVDEETELSLQRERVRQAVAQLPADQQQALALAYFTGYTHREIAEVLGEPLGTVKSRIRLGMQKLRHMLQEEEQQQPAAPVRR